jgi:5'(3')-deoxyribonucleotidase
MIIKLDVDGVLRNFVDSFHRTYLKVYPEHADSIKLITEWSFEKAYPIGAKVKEFMYDEYLWEIFFGADAYDGAKKFFDDLKQIGKVHIVTHQPVGKEIPTLRWLKKFDFRYDAISFVLDKTQIAGDVLIDDAIHNLEAEAKFGKSFPIAISRLWNTNWNGWKFDTFDEIVTFVSGLNNIAIPIIKPYPYKEMADSILS